MKSITVYSQLHTWTIPFTNGSRKTISFNRVEDMEVHMEDLGDDEHFGSKLLLEGFHHLDDHCYSKLLLAKLFHLGLLLPKHQVTLKICLLSIQ